LTEVRFIFSARSRLTRLATNSPVSWAKAALSFSPSEENQTMKGRVDTALKKE
jgi:hypothetical protein